MPKCKKCGCRYAKKQLDSQLLCRYCSDDLSFIARSSIITRKEAERNRPPDEFIESEDFKLGKTDPLFTSFGAMIFYLVYSFIFAKDNYGDLSFIGAWLKPFVIAFIIGFLVLISHALIGTAVKRKWVKLANKLTTMQYVKIFSVLSFILIPLIIALAVAIKAKI